MSEEPMSLRMLGENYQYENGYIGLRGIEFPKLPQNLEIEGVTLQRKSEFHLTIICAKRIAELIDSEQKENIKEQIVTIFEEYVKSHPLTEYVLLPQYRVVKRDERVTVIVMVEMPAIHNFFQFLREKYNTALPDQPTHITLYTLQLNNGIGLLSREELEKESSIIALPELDGLLKS